MNLEQAVFFGVAKAVRVEMDARRGTLEHWGTCYDDWGKEKRINPFIHVYDCACLRYAGEFSGKDLSWKQFWAIFFKLEKMGLVKLHKGHRRRTTKMGLDTKGVEYLKQLKKRKKEVS